ncbi:hypothetical protein CpB0528 [Chlamydia pneumoniae TW-183]|uniref:Uncharacterized protein n=2 Tax=Chlamydia pneumoniae TaxID=83558 RepID=A0ABN3YQ24_CHLPN|nr:hypothetical protein [Chlamydia pneumoniae]AAD18647.1 CT421.1 hypothetical protein [Chlamydia pneumoniae CWL029]AAP98457.1 hypothetical protein CpB0528 [Chlamydia pneumoniae TW-183]BAA98713.1 CT421.1 hypothetical protein [Chlamydia pneumoniae J138]
MTRMSKQARRRAKSPKKRKPKYAIVHPAPAPRIVYKLHTNALSTSDSIFIPKIG